MTEQQIPQTEQPPVLPTVQVDVTTAGPDDRLAALYAAYPAAKAAADEAAKTLKAITDGIKVELTSRAPEGTQRLELRGEHGTPLRLAWQVTRRFNTKRFQAEQAAVYESYREPSGSWVLSPIKDGER